MAGLKESTKSLTKILENTEDWKVDSKGETETEVKTEVKTEDSVATKSEDPPTNDDPKAEEAVKAEEEEESDEEEEEEEEEDLGFEIKLDTSAEAGKTQNYFNQPISLQTAQAPATNAGVPVEQSGNKTLVPTPSQNRESIFDAEYLTTGDRPWNKPGADITDYFNYGFTDRTWEIYHAKQKKKRTAHSMQERIGVYEASKDESAMALPPELSGGRDSQDRSRNRGSSSGSRPDRGHSRRPRSDDMVQLGDSRGDEYTITPSDSRDHRYESSRGRDDRRDRSDSHSRSSRRDDRRPDPRDERDRDRLRDRERRSSRDDDRGPRRDFRDERSAGRKRTDYPKGPENDRKRSRHY